MTPPLSLYAAKMWRHFPFACLRAPDTPPQAHETDLAATTKNCPDGHFVCCARYCNVNQPECYGIECYELTYQILCVACCLGTFGGMLLSWRTRALTAKSDTGSSNTDQ